MKKQVIQKHHLSYDPEITVRIKRGEHYTCTLLNRHTRPSKGFIKAVKHWVVLNEDRGEDI